MIVTIVIIFVEKTTQTHTRTNLIFFLFFSFRLFFLVGLCFFFQTCPSCIKLFCLIRFESFEGLQYQCISCFGWINWIWVNKRNVLCCRVNHQMIVSKCVCVCVSVCVCMNLKWWTSNSSQEVKKQQQNFSP